MIEVSDKYFTLFSYYDAETVIIAPVFFFVYITEVVGASKPSKCKVVGDIFLRKLRQHRLQLL